IAGNTWQVAGNTDDFYSLMNADGYPTAAPATSQWILIVTGLLQDPADGFSGRWVLDWTTSSGSVTMTVENAGSAITISQQSSTSNSIVWNITSGTLSPFSPISVRLKITSITGPITGIRFYPQRYQTLLNSGQIWDPDFINFYKVWGRVRFMDWVQAGGNN